MARAGYDVLRGSRSALSATSGEDWLPYGDFGPSTPWEGLLIGVDVIVHLAASHLANATTAAAAEAFIVSTSKVPDALHAAAAAAGVRRLILMSSALVHGETSPHRPFTEEDEPNPISPYACSKLQSERRLRIAAGSALQWTILRPPLVYGARARGNFRRLVELVRKGLPLPLGAATAPRSFIGVDNLADAVVRCIEDDSAANQVFLLGDAESSSTADLVRRIAATLARPVMVPRISPTLVRSAFQLARRGRDYHRLFDPFALDGSRIRATLDWSPPISMEDGLRRALAAPDHSKAGSTGTR